MGRKLIAIFVALPLALSLVACNAEPEANTLVQHNWPIINGDLPDEPFHDAVVSLHQREGSSWYPNIFCSGTLIAPDVVLTAAHCLNVGRRTVVTMPPEELVIFVGNAPVDWAYGGGEPSDELHVVSETLIHPAYNPNQLTDDIALVRLASPSAHTTVPNLPASLGFTAADEGELVLNFAGFGQTEDGTYDIKLQIDGLLDHIQSAGQIYYYQQTGGPCFGDSGGPAFVKRGNTAYVGGMTSYGDSYCEIYGVSTRADAYEAFIADFVGTQLPFCGDGTCDPNEDCASCAADCGACEPVCGDGSCNGDETCASCATDCGDCPTCGDGSCNGAETCGTCQADCGPCEWCGDGVCNNGEDCDSCAADCGACPPVCGDGVCEGDEDCNSCEADCGACQTCAAKREYCSSNSDCCSGVCRLWKHSCR